MCFRQCLPRLAFGCGHWQSRVDEGTPLEKHKSAKPSHVSLSSFLRSLVCLRAFSEKPSIISQSHRKLATSKVTQQGSVKRGLLRWVGGTSKLVSTSSLGGLDTVQLAGCLEAQPARAASLRRLELLQAVSPLPARVFHCSPL